MPALSMAEQVFSQVGLSRTWNGCLGNNLLQVLHCSYFTPHLSHHWAVTLPSEDTARGKYVT